MLTMSKMQKNMEIYDSADYLELLSTLSMKEVMVLEFQLLNSDKWQKMVSFMDGHKRSCNVCQVVQCGEKNLFSHLSGKKHNMKMDTVKQLRLPKGYGEKSPVKKNTSAQSIPESSQTVAKPAPSAVSYKRQIAPNLKPIATKPQPNKMDAKAKTETIISKKTVAPKKELVSRPNTTVAVSKIELPSTTKTAVEAPNKDLVATSKTPVEVPKKDLIPKLKISVEAPKKPLVSKPQVNFEAPKKAVVENPEKPVKSTDAVETSSDIQNTTKSKSNTDNIVECTPKPVSSSNDTSISKSSISLANEEKDEPTQPNVAKELSDHCNVDNLPQKETKTKSITMNLLKPSSQLNIVINPLSKAAAKERKISCVPISKLISPTPPGENKFTVNVDTDDDVVTVAESPSKDIEIIGQKIDKSNENKTKNKEKVVTPAVLGNNYLPTPGIVGPTFETTSAVTNVLGLLGVEYVLKIVKTISDTSPRFLCTLCDITTDELSMHNHLLSNTHRLKYCEEHFPTAIRQYKQYISEVPEHQVHKILTPILNKLAIAIETHHGRENSYLCYDYWFSKNKKSLISTAFNRRHASEALGPTFTHVVDSTEVDLLIENAIRKIDKSINNVTVVNNMVHFNPFNTSNNMFYPNHQTAYNNRPPVPVNTNYLHNIETVDDETHKRLVENFLRGTRHSSPNRSHRSLSRVSKRVRSKSKSAERKRKRSSPVINSQWDIKRRSISPLRDGDIWQAYRHMVNQSVRELNTTFDLYKSDPEQHPSYKDEWQKFWKRRKDELIAAGINHRTYNYQSEWILYFNARLEELYNQDVENIKIKCRERLCLPMTNSELTDPKYHVNISEPDPEPEPEGLKKTQHETVNTNENRRKLYETTEDVNVIHVLRLLTALENYLGSLGPSITELLAKALQMSKIQPDKVNQFILTSENCTILETAKEKFTGLIISKILDANQERALKKAVNDTESLLAYAAEIRTQLKNRDVDTKESTAQDQLKLGSSQKSSSKVFDKSELATKLASSLISQGKTSINQEQLKQIIEVYSLIEQKKQQEPPSTSRAANNLTNSSSSSLMFKQTKAPNELPFQGSTSNNFSAQNRVIEEQAYNFNQMSDRRTFSNQQQFMNPQMTSDEYNMKTSSNYFSANMARINNANFNQNPNQMDYTNSGQESQYNHYGDHPFDSGQFTSKRNPSSLYMDRSSSYGPTNNTGEKPNWM